MISKVDLLLLLLLVMLKDEALLEGRVMVSS
jgi:hypothetical protein